MTFVAIPPAIRVTLATSTNSSPSNACGTAAAARPARGSPAAACSIALSACHGRAEWPERPWNVHVALMLPRQPACSSHAVGSIITTSSAASGSRASSGVSADSRRRQLLAAEEQAADRRAGERELEHHGDGALHVARAEPVDAPAVDPPRPVVLRGDGVEVAGEQHRRVRRPGEHARVAEVAHRRRRRRARTPATCSASRASSRDSEAMSISSSVRAASRSPRSTRRTIASRAHALLRRRHLGQARPTSSSSRCTSGARPTAASSSWRRSTRPARSSRSRARSRASGAGGAVVAVDAPSGPRRDLLAAGRAAARRARAARRPLRADAGLRRAALPPRAAALPGARGVGVAPQGWEEWIGVGFELFAALAGLGLYRPEPTTAAIAPVGSAALRFGRALRDLPGRDLLRPARPPAVAQAHAVGAAAADRGAAHEGRRGRRRRALAPHARRARRVRRRLRRLRARGRARAVGRRAGGGRHRAARRRAARPLRASSRRRPAPRSPEPRDPRLHWKGVEKTRSGRTTSHATRRRRRRRAPSSARIVVGALPEGDLEELKELLRTAGVAVVGELVQRRDQPHPNLYLGPGKVEELKAADQGGRTRTWSPATTSSRRARSATWRRSSGSRCSTGPR